MRRNKIPLCAFIGANLIVFSLFFLSVYATVLTEDRLGNYDAWELAAVVGFLILGCTGILTGIGLMLRKKWARVVLNVILILGFAFFAVVLYYTISDMILYPRRNMEETGLTFFGLLTLIGIFLFLNNSKVVEELE